MSDNTNAPSWGGENSSPTAGSAASEAPPSTPSAESPGRSTESVARTIDPGGYPQTMTAASNDLREQFSAAASGNQQGQKAEEKETIGTLREHLAKLEKQQTKCSSVLQYNLQGPGGTEILQGISDKNAQAIKATQERISAMEKAERRKHYMERAQQQGPEEQEDEQPDRS